MKRLPKNPTDETVLRAIAILLREEMTREEIAGAMGVSVRTLERRMSEMRHRATSLTNT